jgi:hypothetical protein
VNECLIETLPEFVATAEITEQNE